MLNFIRIKLHALGLVVKNAKKTAGFDVIEILAGYLKALFIYVFGVKLLGLKITSAKIAGYRFNFYSYRVFINLFEEIFIYHTYFFKCDTKTPFIIDCGSNIGISVLYFKKLYPGAHITAFEADKEAFLMLEKNVQDNNLKDIKLINKALYDSNNKKLNFYANSSDSGNPVNALTKRKDEFKFKAPVTVLTEVLSPHINRKLDFLKMDIEGAEDKVLREISKKGRLKYINQSVIEYHHHMEPKQDKLGEILSIFEKNNFGYQLSTWMKPPFNKEGFQDLNIYFYKK